VGKERERGSKGGEGKEGKRQKEGRRPSPPPNNFLVMALE